MCCLHGQSGVVVQRGGVSGVGGGGGRRGLYTGVDWLELNRESEGGKMSVNMVRV